MHYDVYSSIPLVIQITNMIGILIAELTFDNLLML